MRRFLVVLTILAVACRFSVADSQPTASPPIMNRLSNASPLPLSSNPFGLMLGAPGMTLEKRIALVQQLGASYFRPNALFIDSWDNSCDECDAAQQAGLKLILTVRNNGGMLQPSSPPENIALYTQTLGAMLDKYQPTVLIVENEENSNLFYAGTVEQYGTELKAACEVAHGRNMKCANGGLVSSLVVMLAYSHYIEIGDTAKAQSLAERCFTPTERGQLDSDKTKKQIQEGKALLRGYVAGGSDYINFHWYIADPTALAEVAQFLTDQTGLPAMTNEIGQADLSPTTVTDLMSEVTNLQLPYAVWFSIDTSKVRALMSPDGMLRINGLAFQQFIQNHFSH